MSYVRDKARQLLLDGNVTEVEAVYEEDREFQIRSGNVYYRATLSPDGDVYCTCRAGQFGTGCAHLAAAAMFVFEERQGRGEAA